MERKWVQTFSTLKRQWSFRYVPNRKFTPSLAVWMPPKSWLKQNGPPATAAPEASVAVAQLPSVWSPTPMNMYSPLTLQLGANAHSKPPPIVPAVTVSEIAVAIPQLPQPVATVKQLSVTEARTGRKAAPPLA